MTLNNPNKTLTLCQPNCFGFAFENNENFHASEINSHLANMQESNAESEFSDAEPKEESIDEQIIAEHQLFDPSDLDKKFKYTNCEINPNLDPELRKRKLAYRLMSCKKYILRHFSSKY